MGMTWTEEQKKVIDLRDRNILVSAAAGSGKTAVLVQRILGRIQDKDDPVDVDRLLIMTFTRAAAGEMKERLSAALEKAIYEDPGNEHLQKQNEPDPYGADHYHRRFLRLCDPQLLSYHWTGPGISHC